jgi:cell wall assembly regulator SMI1
VSLRVAWVDIVRWCRSNAPATAAAIRPPADGATRRRAVAATSGRWPDDLWRWYQLADGTERTPDGYLLPSYCPMPLYAVMSHWVMWVDIGRDLRAWAGDPGDAVARLQTEPAATAAGMFLPSFVPIAEDQSGSDLIVDTRHGEAHGCVTEYDKTDADNSGPRWPSVTAMLTDVAEALHATSPIGYWQPEVEDGRLNWRLR